MSVLSLSTAISTPLRSRLVAAGLHLTLSLVVAAAAAGLMFGLWYPYPYRELSGGRELFFIVVGVDVVLGPLLTLTVFNRAKASKVLRRDLAVIGLLQVAALTYGLWTVAVARPVHLVFEFNRFRVVHAVDVPKQELAQAAPGLGHLPWSGPTLVSLRDFKGEQEKFDLTMDEVQGLLLSARPALWQSYAKAAAQVAQSARPLAELRERFPDRTSLIDEALKSARAGQGPDRPLGYLPLISGERFWTVLLDLTTTEVIAFVPIDSF
jgi:hypothetical protein